MWAISGTSNLDEVIENVGVVEEFPVYMLDDGATLLIVHDGDDYLYTRTADGVYGGALVAPDEDEVWESTLTIADDSHMLETSTYMLGEDCVVQYEIEYLLVNDTPAKLWTETVRTFTNFTFPTCLGLMGLEEPFGTWIDNDELVPIVFLDDLSGIRIGTDDYGVTGEGFYRETDEVIADKPHHYQWTIRQTSLEIFTLDFLYIVDNRDDCAVAYTSQLIRVDGNDELLEELLTAPPPTEE